MRSRSTRSPGSLPRRPPSGGAGREGGGRPRPTFRGTTCDAHLSAGIRTPEAGSRAGFAAFWGRIAREEAFWFKPFERAYDGAPPSFRWFVGGEAALVLQGRSLEIAVFPKGGAPGVSHRLSPASIPDIYASEVIPVQFSTVRRSFCRFRPTPRSGPRSSGRSRTGRGGFCLRRPIRSFAL
ncbi:acetyl-coenzyme A synthetase N-terminal domain-containing protein, partial [Hydrogenibacillus schlegelii]|uniref:acetyl-coenzyme A synthetase N-terminal domain-containing protein n=1 Tax=Hydrogenibacillus schlegelii TaxID=1484 RepID=UPI0034A01341